MSNEKTMEEIQEEKRHAAYWLAKQKFQTARGEQKYLMYFDVDMSKILSQYANYKHESLQSERDKYKQFWEDLKKPFMEVTAERDRLRHLSEDLAVRLTILEYPETVTLYRAGKENLIGALIGQAMIISRGNGNPKTLTDKFRLALSQSEKGENWNG